MAYLAARGGSSVVESLVNYRSILSLLCHAAIVGVLVEVGLVMLTITISPTQYMTWRETPTISAIETFILFGLAFFEVYVIKKGLKELEQKYPIEREIDQATPHLSLGGS